MIGGAGSRHRRRRSSPGVHFAQAQQVARLAALNQRDGVDGDTQFAADNFTNAEFNQVLARRRSSKYSFIHQLTHLIAFILPFPFSTYLSLSSYLISGYLY